MKKIGLTIYALNVFHTGKYHGEEKQRCTRGTNKIKKKR